ncbi:Growth arrest-specific protein 8 domain-containing protein [Rozella allomycis CSF55]|uniref:Growth arrest-specific protein 8 domain-containing protein n=1 Tax=Rozella allomycis (strain CSF55) TaxID=988480 RepID=A0A075B0B7_ROZAC|nr:Growth arrest-specific protein 8 domain-containing protein [Rozella allomycis CSF55]|eukprot:EPZ34234.1 Growth arrest-specific protein 8 domain-containing protein [Rozella allomycis CSF55]
MWHGSLAQLSSKKSSAKSKASAGSKKGSAGSKKGASAGKEVASTGPTIEEMQQKLEAMKLEVEAEKAERNYFQLERDKIASFWEIAKNEADSLKAEVRNKDKELEELEDKHQVEIKVYKQKVKHLLYEYQNNVTHLQHESEQALQLDHDEAVERENDLKKDKKALKLELKELELANEAIIRDLKDKHDQEITKLRQDFERRLKEMGSKYEKRMKVLREDLELRRKNEIHEIEERKNTQINTLMKNHEKAFADIKNYYNDITLNNLALINSLKEQVEDMKKKEEKNEKLMAEITTENKRLSEPLQKALEEGDTLKKKLEQYDKDKNSLAMSKARLKSLEEQMKQINWEYEVLKQKNDLLTNERDNMKAKFAQVAHEAQQKAGMKSAVLEKKMDALVEQLEKKEIQLSEILRASNLDQGALATVNRKLEEVLEGKNNTIRDLQNELARLAKAYNEMVLIVEAKFTEYSIPSDDLHLKAYISKNNHTKNLDKNTASFITSTRSFIATQ